MNNEQEKIDRENTNNSDETTDVTRSQNREAVADAAEHPARLYDNMGKEGTQKSVSDSTGSHREGNYEKNEQKDKSTDLSQKK